MSMGDGLCTWKYYAVGFFFFFFLDGERKECGEETEGEGLYMLPSDVRVANVMF